jgi:hypothetical protein
VSRRDITLQSQGLIDLSFLVLNILLVFIPIAWVAHFAEWKDENKTFARELDRNLTEKPKYSTHAHSMLRRYYTT